MSRRQEHKEQLLQPESGLGGEDRGDDFHSGAGQGQNRLQVFPGPSRSIGPNLGQGWYKGRLSSRQKTQMG